MNPNIQQEIMKRLKRSPSTFYLITKRMFDIVSAFIIIIILLPLYFALSVIILIFDGRPVFFNQKRTGINGETFTIYKFRTMKQENGEPRLIKYNDWSNGVPDDFIFKTSSNPNITKVGGFLRKYSLDELPQFFNVLIGNMSIIGPRPEIPEITIFYNEYQRQRLLVKPGITGLAQVNGRSDLTHREKIEFDLQYIKNCSFTLDIKIFLKTIFHTIFGKGAY